MLLAKHYARLTFTMATAQHFMIPTECEESVPYDAEIHQIGTHMHTRGSASRLERLRPGSAPAVLLDIPRWDWHWEATYSFQKPVALAGGDRIKVSCVYDNGTAAQPSGPNNVAEPPRYVVAGEGRYDDMCGGTLGLVRKPFMGRGYASLCDEAKAIFDHFCPGKQMLSNAAFPPNVCTGETEQLAVFMLSTPADSELVNRLWCNPEPKGAAATVGTTCLQTAGCALSCQLGVCTETCRTKASAQARVRFDNLMWCAGTVCADKKANAEEWSLCAAIACDSWAKTCFQP